MRPPHSVITTHQYIITNSKVAVSRCVASRTRIQLDHTTQSRRCAQRQLLTRTYEQTHIDVWQHTTSSAINSTIANNASNAHRSRAFLCMCEMVMDACGTHRRWRQAAAAPFGWRSQVQLATASWLVKFNVKLKVKTRKRLSKKKNWIHF